LIVISGVDVVVEVVVEPVGDVVVGVAVGGVEVVVRVVVGVAGVQPRDVQSAARAVNVAGFTTVNEVSTLSSTIRSAAGIESLH